MCELHGKFSFPEEHRVCEKQVSGLSGKNFECVTHYRGDVRCSSCQILQHFLLFNIRVHRGKINEQKVFGIFWIVFSFEFVRWGFFESELYFRKEKYSVLRPVLARETSTAQYIVAFLLVKFLDFSCYCQPKWLQREQSSLIKDLIFISILYLFDPLTLEGREEKETFQTVVRSSNHVTR